MLISNKRWRADIESVFLTLGAHEMKKLGEVGHKRTGKAPEWKQ